MVIIRLDEPQWDYPMCAKLEEKLQQALGEPNVIIDLSAVHYMDLECVAVLLRMYKVRVADRGFPPVRIVAFSVGLIKLIERAGVGNLWPIFDDLDDAVKEVELTTAGPKQ